MFYTPVEVKMVVRCSFSHTHTHDLLSMRDCAELQWNLFPLQYTPGVLFHRGLHSTLVFVNWSQICPEENTTLCERQTSSCTVCAISVQENFGLLKILKCIFFERVVKMCNSTQTSRSTHFWPITLYLPRKCLSQALCCDEVVKATVQKRHDYQLATTFKKCQFFSTHIEWPSDMGKYIISVKQ